MYAAPDPVSEGLNQVNFFDEVACEDSDTPNDDNKHNGAPLGNNNQNDHQLGDGSNSQHFGSPTTET